MCGGVPMDPEKGVRFPSDGVTGCCVSPNVFVGGLNSGLNCWAGSLAPLKEFQW